MNKKILTPLFVAASFALIACSTKEIVGRPSWIDDPIVEDVTKDNTLKEIYDAIKKLGDTNANVLNKVMYDVAQKQIGHFEDWTDSDGNPQIGLKTINNGGATPEQIDAFVEKYPIYKSDEKTYVLNADGEPEEKAITEIADKRANSLSKIKAVYNRIYENIFEKLFNEIKGGSYSTKLDKLFEEDYFVQYLYKEMYYDAYDPETTPASLAKDRVFLPKNPDMTWSEYVNTNSTGVGEPGFLHVDLDGKGNFTDYYKEYISRKLLPEIYRTLLIERYVREQRSTNLGRSYARKVNMVTVPYCSDDKQTNIKIQNMLTTFAESKIDKDEPANNFEIIKDAMVGFADNSTVEGMLGTNGANFSKRMFDAGHPFIWGIRTKADGTKDNSTTLQHTYVYKGTKLYDIVDKYLKVVDIVMTGDGTLYTDFKAYPKQHLTSDEQAAYDDLTNKGAYTIEKGLELKEREIRQTDMTQDGWFLKDGGLTDLKDTFRNKLFNITTSNIVDKQITKDTPDPNDTVRYFGSVTPDETGRLSHRKAYVFDPHVAGAASVVLADEGANFYIVEVEEAAASSKLSATEANDSYLQLKATNSFDTSKTNADTNEIFSKVTEQVANSDTYKKNAEQYYLMISNILFYDQSVYDYFKSQFPDLFK